MAFVFSRLALYSPINAIRNSVNPCAPSFWANFTMLDWLIPSCFAICREETDFSSLTLARRKSAIFCSFPVNSLSALRIFVRYNIFHSPGLAAKIPLKFL
ncbi:Uncharacterised protein [Shigella flexneri]|nr:Uncharacterised protein [Shigella flexneri]